MLPRINKLVLSLFLSLLLLPCGARADERPLYVNVSYGSRLNVREWPDLESALISFLPRGAEVYVSQTDGEWTCLYCPQSQNH